jgi:hypothetical protein
VAKEKAKEKAKAKAKAKAKIPERSLLDRKRPSACRRAFFFSGITPSTAAYQDGHICSGRRTSAGIRETEGPREICRHAASSHNATLHLHPWLNVNDRVIIRP